MQANMKQREKRGIFRVWCFSQQLFFIDRIQIKLEKNPEKVEIYSCTLNYNVAKEQDQMLSLNKSWTTQNLVISSISRNFSFHLNLLQTRFLSIVRLWS